LVDGRRFRVLTIVDTVSRVSPAIAVGVSVTGERVVAVLERLPRTVGRPERIAIDNGPEFISKALDAWAYRNGVQLEFSRLGKPTDNAFAESFNGRFRDECVSISTGSHCWRRCGRPSQRGGSRTTRCGPIGRLDSRRQRPGKPLGSRHRRHWANPSGGPIRGAGQEWVGLSYCGTSFRGAGQTHYHVRVTSVLQGIPLSYHLKAGPSPTSVLEKNPSQGEQHAREPVDA